MLRMSVHFVFWSWHLGFRDECVPLSTTKFDWSVKITSIQEEEVERRWVGSDMSWGKPCKDVRASRHAPSTVVLAFFHQKEDLALTISGSLNWIFSVIQQLIDVLLLKSTLSVCKLQNGTNGRYKILGQVQ